ncbi:Zinc finger MYND domain-containing protein 15 [Mycena venus]|uniref:Zinc finger MYND domain-containing protein 15 n=1 Tax=Mycena venus TaxID=2733690 RepID=A0A8H6YB99_9AGAR|nr:Zinc finger MYND domain-containing protein 15 [Mycena venus]
MAEFITTEQIEAHCKVIRQEWDRIKHDPSPRFSLTKHPGQSQCNQCRALMDKPKVCSACKMIYYCSPQCIKTGWKTHKVHCSAFKRDGEQIPKYKAVTKQFPWTDVGYNIYGHFNENFILARFGVLGTTRRKVGYWAAHGRGVLDEDLLDAPWCNLTETEGWRLPNEFIPTLALQNPDSCPTFPPTFDTNWTSYYQWRGLPIASPAAMLLHWPLSVYACLKELGLVSENAVGARRKLTVFYVGAREEVCLIPVFGELALLFPNTDLDLVIFGETTGHALRRAKGRGIKAHRPCVFDYTAPTACGGGTIRVFIDTGNPTYYCPSRERSEHPDVIVALNAGLGSCISWQHVILRSFEFDIPFVITDYCEACLVDVRQTMDLLHQVLTRAPKSAEEIRLQPVFKKILEEVQVGDVEKVCAALKRERPGKLNAFMQPGQKGDDCSKLGPGSRNACIQVITPVTKDVEAGVNTQ